MHAEGAEAPSAIQPLVRVRVTSVEAGVGYLETVLGAAYRVHERVLLGLHLPLVGVQEDETTQVGLGNVVVFGSWSALELGTDGVLDLGLQLEIPTVTDPSLGDGHFLILPTLQAGWHPGSGILMGVLGWGRVLDGGHHHHAAGSIVNPHADSEILLRFDGGRSWELSQTSLRATLRADGIQALGHHEEAESILNLGPALGLSGDRGTVEIYGLVPVTESRRYALRSGVRLSLQLP
jgi:hypothetical protein